MSKNLKFDSETHVLTVPAVDGVVYTIGGRVVEGEVQLDKTSVVHASSLPGYSFPKGAQKEFEYVVEPIVFEPGDVDPADTKPNMVWSPQHLDD